MIEGYYANRPGYQYNGTPWLAIVGEIVGRHKCQHCDYIIKRGQHTICGPCLQRRAS